ncbi:MAG: LEA type 2 family protein [Candidatus Bathyarchaeia archaeon]
MASGKIVALAVVLIVVVVVAGLAVYYYDAYHKLTFELKGVDINGVSLTSVQTTFEIQIGNPNALPVYIPDGNFEIYVNNQDLGSGTFGAVTVAGNSQTQLNVPVTFNVSDVPPVVYGLITGGGNINVTIQGTANVGFFGVPFSTTLYNVTLS